MLKLRFVIFGAGAALALGMGSALAMQTGAGGNDSHGDAVASAARTTCPHGPGGVHGQCVSAIASSKSEDGSKDSRENANPACTKGDATEDSSEGTATTSENDSETGDSNSKAAAHSTDKSAKAAARAEDKSERNTTKACTSAGDTGDSQTGDSQGGD